MQILCFVSYTYLMAGLTCITRAVNMNDLSPDLGPKIGFSQHLIEAARDQSRVKGLTHEFYRYPARFSPSFVRGAIEAFTRPGDWVMDPFAGGGTTLVEAMAMGRNALGIDISS